MHTDKDKWSRPKLLDFNDWLKRKAEAHEMMKVTSLKPKADENSTAITKTKTAMKVFASTSKADAPTVGRSVLPTQPVRCTACKITQPLWRSFVFRGKTPTQRAKVVDDNEHCLFLCSTLFDSARNHANAPQKVAQAPTTSCYTEPKTFCHLNQ